MTPEDWKTVDEIFQRALELKIERREDFLREQSAGENVLAEVRALLESHEEDESFLQGSAFDAGLRFVAAPEDFSGERVGAYKIIGELGRGGMGAVYEAFRADGAFERRAAVKILPRSFVSEPLAARFGRERQILANLNHANIAQLFDGGETADGTPYFVMELVRGSSIIEFCRERNLSIEERLKIFLKVCAAVSYAHAQGVVHRDLKPSNILINEKGEPKLLDFGIAKFLSNDAGGDTTSGFSFLTPEYASPEQVSGRAATGQTDVYSLGIVLYELLTEARPYEFENRSPAGIAGVICDTEPLAPSRRIAELKTESQKSKTENQSPKTGNEKAVPRSAPRVPHSKDLDYVVLKALRKDAARRYQSVAEFADDIERFLNGLPVKAAPDRFVYRAGKYFRRRRLSSAAIAASVLTIFAATLIYRNFIGTNPTRKDAARRVTSGAAADSYPQFTPDGKIVFVRQTKSVERVRTGDDTTRFFIVDRDGANAHLLNDALLADRGKFSPDGKRFVFRDTRDYRLYVTDSGFKSAPQKITRYAGGRPVWSPDGARIFFVYNLSEKYEEPSIPLYRDGDDIEIFSVGANGEDEKNITNNRSFNSDANVSPDGKQIVFASNRDGNFEIYVMNSDGSDQRRLTTNDVDDANPVWSPDGKRIAFVSRRADDNDEIFLMNADGSNVRRATFSAGNDHEPAWSPDGGKIVFAYDEKMNGDDDLFVINAPPAE